jgi:hypothetical protein
LAASKSLTPEQRRQRARIAIHERWSRQDPVAGTEPARRAFRESFETKVDPDRTLDPAERARRAEHAYKAHMQRLAFASAKARAARKAAS